MKLLELSNKNYLASTFCAILLLIIQPLLLVVVAFVVLFSIYFMAVQKIPFIIYCVIVSALVLTNTISPTLRLVVQLLNYLLLSLIFFKEYEFELKNYPRPPQVIVKYLMLLLLLMLISSFFSSNISLGLSQILRTVLFFYMVYIIYSFITEDNIYRIYLFSLFSVACIYLIFLVYEFARFDFDLLNLNLNGFDENGSAFVHKNALGSFFVLTIILLMSFSFKKKYSHFRRYIYFLIIIFIGGLIVTNARAAIISLLVGFVIFIYYTKRTYLKYLLIGVSSSILLYFILPIQKYLELYFRFERITTGRDFILSATWKVIKNNWLLGAGPAGTRGKMYIEMPYMLGSSEELYLRHHYSQIEFGHAHNFYLFFLSDLGIIGLILSVILPVIFFNISLKTISFNKDQKSDDYYLAIGITSFGAAMFVRGLFEWGGILSYGTIGYDLPFWIVFAIQVYLYQKTKLTKS